MRVHRSYIIAFGLLVLSECVAFGDDKNKVDAQVAQPAERQGEHKPGSPIESPDKRQDESKAKAGEQLDKDQDSSVPPSAATASDAGSRPDLQASDLRDSVCLMIQAAARAHDLPLEFCGCAVPCTRHRRAGCPHTGRWRFQTCRYRRGFGRRPGCRGFGRPNSRCLRLCPPKSRHSGSRPWHRLQAHARGRIRR
jgi:hypothetical protein